MYMCMYMYMYMYVNKLKAISDQISSSQTSLKLVTPRRTGHTRPASSPSLLSSTTPRPAQKAPHAGGTTSHSDSLSIKKSRNKALKEHTHTHADVWPAPEGGRHPATA